jgi:hypothetical protein
LGAIALPSSSKKIARYPTMKNVIQFKYKINQKVRAPFCSFTLIVIKSIRYVTEIEARNEREKFTSIGPEYQLYYYSSDKGWREWGWLTEKELDTIND